MSPSFSDLVDYCASFSQYPKRLLSPGATQPYTLRDLGQRLNSDASRLFCKPGNAKLVIVRYDSSQCTITEKRLATLPDLQQHVTCNADFGRTHSLCHWAFIEASSFRNFLEISRDMMLYLCSFFQVMPAFIELILPFGRKLYDSNFHFSAFRQDVRLDPKAGRGKLDEVNRSGQDYQLCYNLKSVVLSIEQDWPWSFQQAAVSHCFDVGKGSSSWILLEAQSNIRQRVTEVLKTILDGNPDAYSNKITNFAHSLVCHMVLANWCVENWRWYIEHFEERLDPEELLPGIGKPGEVAEIAESKNMFKIDKLQSAQYLETKANESLLVIKSNIGIIAHLSHVYQDIGTSHHLDPAFKSNIQDSIREFTRRLAELQSELENYQDWMQTIVKRVTDRKNLLYSLVQYQTIEANTTFAKQVQTSASRWEDMTKDMQILTRNAARDTVLIRVIALMTLFFLPAIFVSTLMSAYDFPSTLTAATVTGSWVWLLGTIMSLRMVGLEAEVEVRV